MITSDGSKANNVAPKKGTIEITLNISEDKSVNTKLENPFYVPWYPQDNIFCTSGNGKVDNSFFSL